MANIMVFDISLIDKYAVYNIGRRKP